MPAPASILPPQPETIYTKPTYSNTRGGKTYKPTHQGLLRVEFTPPADGQDGEAYSSRLVVDKDIPPNTVVTFLNNLSSGTKAYSSVQYGVSPHEHFELNSDLLFMNHSCEPTVYLDISSRDPTKWHVRTTSRGLRAGEDVTFFYPSTEWDMAQGFDCSCGTSTCLGHISGAKHLSLEQLESRGYVNEHIRTLKSRQTSNGHI
ncbi:hypothetical protein BCR39DRAFT_540529 [Naematelia encephala]|uniref:Post-SET domain-containing protein n=1 Tax=Naematelia encephala TaxID=71784 RepID=A0A1Y2AXT1_9TREE|nr:hypothetical protein BCR39DRAFT_540529 [Naematelia encephala]